MNSSQLSAYGDTRDTSGNEARKAARDMRKSNMTNLNSNLTTLNASVSNPFGSQEQPGHKLMRDAHLLNKQMVEMKIDQNESINLHIQNANNNSHISSGQNTSFNRSAKTKFIKPKAKVDTNLSMFSGKNSYNSKTQTNKKRKLDWDDYFRS